MSLCKASAVFFDSSAIVKSSSLGRPPKYYVTIQLIRYLSVHLPFQPTHQVLHTDTKTNTNSRTSILAKQHSIYSVARCSHTAHAKIYSFDLTPSNRNFTSFKTLLIGFQASNCFKSSFISSYNSARTIFSSNTPRIANGRMYGFCEIGGVDLFERKVH